MTITKQTVATQLGSYLRHQISLNELVDWSERALLDGDLSGNDAGTIAQALARLGVADVRAFGLTWDDCAEILHKLGFEPRVEVVAV